MPMEPSESTVSQQAELDGILAERDEAGFRELVQPHMASLLRVAAQELDFYVFEGYLRDGDFSPEELVGEALINAWEHLGNRPRRTSLAGWLLGVLYRSVGRLVEQHQAYQNEKAISLDAPLPENPDSMSVQEWFWEWYQPEANMTWEDVVPAVEPVDLDLPLYDLRDTLALDPEARHVLMMHDEFSLPLPEVAMLMNRAVDETANLIDQARASLRERLAAPEPVLEVSHPAPPDGSDR